MVGTPVYKRSEHPSIWDRSPSVRPMDRGDPSPAAERLDPVLAVLPFVAFALVSIAMILLWAPDPRWGFVIVLPFLFLISLTWLAFRAAP